MKLLLITITLIGLSVSTAIASPFKIQNDIQPDFENENKELKNTLNLKDSYISQINMAIAPVKSRSEFNIFINKDSPLDKLSPAYK